MKTSQQLEIERYERTRKMWARRQARWAAYKAGKVDKRTILLIDFKDVKEPK